MRNKKPKDQEHQLTHSEDKTAPTSSTSTDPQDEIKLQANLRRDLSTLLGILGVEETIKVVTNSEFSSPIKKNLILQLLTLNAGLKLGEALTHYPTIMPHIQNQIPSAGPRLLMVMMPQPAPHQMQLQQPQPPIYIHPLAIPGTQSQPPLPHPSFATPPYIVWPRPPAPPTSPQIPTATSQQPSSSQVKPPHSS